MSKPPTPIAERFWPKVDKREPDECWPWLAAITTTGYGAICSGKRSHKVQAHRVAYELLVGPIPNDMVIDHLCRNRACVNPAHLEPVTNVENVMRGESVPARNARKTHCKHGHEFTEENTGWNTGGGYRKRFCRACAKGRRG